MKQLTWQIRGGQVHSLGARPWIMGILNCTPDSFSDGGEHGDPEQALAHALAMVEAGADIIDIGGESTRPGAAPVSAEAERRRVIPVIAKLADASECLISVDTWKASVARAALDAGAHIVNDVSGLHRDPEMLDVLAESDAGCVAMHMRGTPATMQQHTNYVDISGEICDYFEALLETAERRGVDAARFVLDPGLGFAKTADQNLRLIAATPQFRALGRPVLLGPSRKSFIGRILDRTEPKDRDWGTAGAVAACVLAGGDIMRVHDVPAMRDVALVAAALRQYAS